MTHLFRISNQIQQRQILAISLTITIEIGLEVTKNLPQKRFYYYENFPVFLSNFDEFKIAESYVLRIYILRDIFSGLYKVVASCTNSRPHWWLAGSLNVPVNRWSLM